MSEHWSETHKRRMRGLLTRDVRRGYVIPAASCEKCGRGGKLQAHHVGYDDYTSVMWLCPECHARLEREIRKERKREAQAQLVRI